MVRFDPEWETTPETFLMAVKFESKRKISLAIDLRLNMKENDDQRDVPPPYNYKFRLCFI